ncbi:Acyl carrier protein [Streptomyces sp. TLI_053]|uniref:phosphopantetheine-binding protein n=1 Tax=Streptomyces sp. TLI_053 TaxID=1855352 RepID=UPI000879E1E1|nr:phosphopantetheine-binding protein [Streptomyces sp. TLI_053]SDT83343.1 Acyl carrier protein [Streptomyces sp. TLI_053]
MNEDLLDRVRTVVVAALAPDVPLTDLRPDQDLWTAGMDSMASVRVMLAVEETFGIEFPEEALTRETLASVTAIATALRDLAGPASGAAG